MQSAAFTLSHSLPLVKPRRPSNPTFAARFDPSRIISSSKPYDLSRSNNGGVYASQPRRFWSLCSASSSSSLNFKFRPWSDQLKNCSENASSFKGRTASLAKKLKNMVELVFVDAPHELPFIYQPSPVDAHDNSTSTSLQKAPPPPPEHCKKKFAWFVAPSFNTQNESDWKIANCPFDSLQYQQQTGGFDASLAYLKDVFAQEGPFDGILGFSQGAAMAAEVCARLGMLKGEIDLRFVILCFGFGIKLLELEHELINCPSLHTFGSDHGKDRQIANQASRDLASLFDDGCSVRIENDRGHIIPTRSPYIDQLKDFLQCFL